jgi:predicted ATPase
MTVIETAKEGFFEAEVNRVAGEIALKSPQPDPAKAEAYFERSPAVARKQQAKSWELRAAMSMARLWRDQGKRDEARELLAPVTVPAGFTKDGLPIGLQIVGRHLDDATVLRAAAAYEAAAPWKDKWPPMLAQMGL